MSPTPTLTVVLAKRPLARSRSLLQLRQPPRELVIRFAIARGRLRLVAAFQVVARGRTVLAPRAADAAQLAAGLGAGQRLAVAVPLQHLRIAGQQTAVRLLVEAGVPEDLLEVLLLRQLLEVAQLGRGRTPGPSGLLRRRFRRTTAGTGAAGRQHGARRHALRFARRPADADAALALAALCRVRSAVTALPLAVAARLVTAAAARLAVALGFAARLAGRAALRRPDGPFLRQA